MGFTNGEGGATNIDYLDVENLESLTNHTPIGCGVVGSIPHEKVVFRGFPSDLQISLELGTSDENHFFNT